VKKGYLVVGELPQSGAIPMMRTNGEAAGFLATIKDFPADQVIRIDTKNTLQESFAQMTNVLPRIRRRADHGDGDHDQSASGMLRAAKQAGREDDVIAVGMGADETETLVGEKRFVASVGYFPERYGNYLLPIALMHLAGKEVPPSVLVNHVMISKANVCEYYPNFKCDPNGRRWTTSSAGRVEAYIASLRGDRRWKPTRP